MPGRITPRVAERMPRGMALVRVSSDVLDIARRVTKGDELWRGDETMGVYFDELDPDNRWQVWGLDALGQPYMAASADTCDHRLLQRLVAGDWQRGHAALDMLVTNNVKNRERQEAAEDEKRWEISERLAWALKRDLGHLYSGTTRDLWSVDWRPKETA